MRTTLAISRARLRRAGEPRPCGAGRDARPPRGLQAHGEGTGARAGPQRDVHGEGGRRRGRLGLPRVAVPRRPPRGTSHRRCERGAHAHRGRVPRWAAAVCSRLHTAAHAVCELLPAPCARHVRPRQRDLGRDNRMCLVRTVGRRETSATSSASPALTSTRTCVSPRPSPQGSKAWTAASSRRPR